jgi:hypothetical protein
MSKPAIKNSIPKSANASGVALLLDSRKAKYN